MGLGKLFIHQNGIDDVPKRHKVRFDLSYNVYKWFLNTGFDRKIERALHEHAVKKGSSVTTHDINFEIPKERMDRVLQKLKRFARKEKESFMVEIHPK